MEITINGIDLDKVSAIDTEGIHVILGEGDEMLHGYYIDAPHITAEGSNFAWLRRNLLERREQLELINDTTDSSL